MFLFLIFPDFSFSLVQTKHANMKLPTLNRFTSETVEIVPIINLIHTAIRFRPVLDLNDTNAKEVRRFLIILVDVLIRIAVTTKTIL